MSDIPKRERQEWTLANFIRDLCYWKWFSGGAFKN